LAKNVHYCQLIEVHTQVWVSWRTGVGGESATQTVCSRHFINTHILGVCVCIWWTAAGVKLQRWSTTSIGNVPEIRSSPCAIKNLAPPNLCWLSVKTIATEMVNRWYAVYYSGAFFFAYSRIHTVYEFHVQRSIASSLTWNMYIHTY